MKGVSTVIATILMLMIAVGLAAVTAGYVFNWFSGQTATSIDLDKVATRCVGTTITVYVKNTGTERLTADKITISGNTAAGGTIASTACGVVGTVFTPGGGALACTNTVTGSAGTNTIIVSGPTNTMKTTVSCSG
jgi:FlaG/FlaF family flagellin (archaellin)